MVPLFLGKVSIDTLISTNDIVLSDQDWSIETMVIDLLSTLPSLKWKENSDATIPLPLRILSAVQCPLSENNR